MIMIFRFREGEALFMIPLLKKISDISSQTKIKQTQERYRELIRQEARLGGQLFGGIPKNHRREFFCLDEHTWVWYEEWTTKGGRRESRTTRYDVRPGGIVKVQDNAGYQALSLSEAKHLKEAIRLYNDKVIKVLYGTTI